jgi:formate-dependent nitrite reductase membrane component NrfD
MEAIGVILGLATTAYTGLLLSFARGVPFWQSAFLPWLFVLSGLLTGLAITVLLTPILAELMPKAFKDFKEMWSNKIYFTELIEYTDKHALPIIVIEFIVMLLYFVTTSTTGIVWGGSSISMYFYAYILFALLIPLAITFYNKRLVATKEYKSMIYLTLLATVFTLVGGFLLRYVVLIGGQII